MLNDKVFAKDIAATAITGKDAWNRPSPQPITICVSLDTDFHQASVTDNLKYSLNYAVISRNISEFMKANEHRNFKSLGNIAESVSEIVLDEKKGGSSKAEVVVKSTKSEIRADSVEYRLSRSKTDSETVPDEITVKGLRLLTIIGVFTFERFQRQILDIDLQLKLHKESDVSIHEIIDDVVSYVESSNFKTVEALVMKIGQLIFQNHQKGVTSVFAKVTKPNAISYTEGVGVSSLMTRASFEGLAPIPKPDEFSAHSYPSERFNLPTAAEAAQSQANEDHVAYIAFGSNEGSQVENIRTALKLLEKYDVKVQSTSSLYISKPMYYLNQPDFYNGAIKVTFKNKSPHDLLAILKKIEYENINRKKEFDNGPRSIDLDIILYDDISVNHADLIIPHKSMLERTFVLQPICELLPPDHIHPVSAEPIHNHLSQLLLSKPNESVQESSDLLQLIPVPRLTNKNTILKFDQLKNSQSTLIMGIVNLTPDSFSDGGMNFSKSIDEVLKTAKGLIDDGAQILDIGGVSTRPGSKEPTEEEELQRVLPLVKAIRASSDKQLSSCLISVDTYRAKVAEECLKAGADIINDISMGLYEESIFDVVAKYGCPYIMNHTRGTAATMSSLTNYESNTNDDIIEYLVDPILGHQELDLAPEVNNLINGVSRELSLQMLKAFDRGVRKWQIIVDPGIGFAKNLSQNLQLIKHASLFKQYSVQVNVNISDSNRRNASNGIKHMYVSFNGLATLLGTSRKNFLGSIIDQPVASQRMVATAASVIACIQQKTDIVRVHDVKDIKEAVLTGDAIYRDLYKK